MKKYVVYILLTCLLLSCFAGCKQAETTPEEVTQTDVTQTQVEVQEDLVVAEESEQSEEEKEGEQSPSTVDKKQTVKEETVGQSTKTTATKKQSVSTKKESTTQSKPVANQTVVSKVNPNDIHACVVESGPTFVSEEAFQIWLKQGSGKFETERSNYIQTNAKNQSITYYRLKNNLSQYVTLDYLESNEHHIATYVYKSNKNEYMTLNVGNVDGESLYKYYQKKAEENTDGYSAVTDKNNNIVFYVHHSDLSSVSVRWEQFGKFHSVRFSQWNNDTVNEIIPLLALEQVTVNLNSDQVVK